MTGKKIILYLVVVILFVVAWNLGNALIMECLNHKTFQIPENLSIIPPLICGVVFGYFFVIKTK